MNASRTSAFGRRALIQAIGGTIVCGKWFAGCGAAEREATARELGRLTIGTDENGHTLHGVLVRRARRAGYTVESVDMQVIDAATGRPVMYGNRPLTGRFIRSLPNMGSSDGGYIVEFEDNGRFVEVSMAWHIALVATGQTFRVMQVPGPLDEVRSAPLHPNDQAVIEAAEAWARNG